MANIEYLVFELVANHHPSVHGFYPCPEFLVIELVANHHYPGVHGPCSCPSILGLILLERRKL